MLFVGGVVDEVLLALFTPEIGLLHVGKLNSGEGGLLIFHNSPVANDIVLLAVEVVDECGFIAEVGAACDTPILVDLQYRALMVCKILKSQERLAVLVTVRAETVAGSFLVSLSGSRVAEDLQAGRTGIVVDSQMLSAVALDAEVLVWTCGAPEAIRSVFALVRRVDHESLEKLGLADPSRRVLVGLELCVGCEEFTAIAANRVTMLNGMVAQRCLCAERGVAEAAVWRHGGITVLRLGLECRHSAVRRFWWRCVWSE